VLFGLATLSYTRHPEGFLDFLSGRVQTAIADRRAHRLGGGPDGHGPVDGGVGKRPTASPDPVIGGPG